MASEPTSGGTRRAVLAATLAAAALVAQQVVGKATRDAFFLSQFQVRSLPWATMAGALIATITVLGYSRRLARLGPAQVVPAAVGASALLLLVEWALSWSAPRLAALALYLHMAAFGPTLVSGFWSLVTERFDPYTARRVMSRVGAGACLGGVAGGALAWGVAGLVPLPAMLPALALVLGVAFLALSELRAACAPPPGSERPDRGADSPSGIRVLWETPYLRDLAVIVGLGSLTETLLDYVLSAEASAALGGGPELLSFFALYHTGVGLLAFLLQSSATPAALGRLGLGGTVSLKPALVAAGSLLGALAPRLASAVLARGAAAALHNSLHRSAYELLYTPLPEPRKRPAKALVDIGVDKLGTALGGALALLAVAAAEDAAQRGLFALAALTSLALLWVCRRLHRGYVAALEASLRSGAVRLLPGDAQDATTLATLAQTGLSLDRPTLLRQLEALRAAGPLDAGPGAAAAEEDFVRRIRALRRTDVQAVRRALLETDAHEPALVPLLIPLLARSELFHDALRALRRAAPRATGALVDALLDPATPQLVRRRIPRVLGACPTPRAADGLLLGLADEHWEVRRSCGLALGRIVERGPELRIPHEVIHAAVLRELAGGAWPEADRRLEHVFNLLALVLEREPVRIASWALRSHDRLRGTALEYLVNVLPEAIRAALWPVLGAASVAAPGARRREDLARELVQGLRGRRTGPHSGPGA